MLKIALVSTLLVQLIGANEFYIDDHTIPNEFFKGLQPLKTPEERLTKLNNYIGEYAENRTKAYEDMPFLQRKLFGSQVPQFHHDEVSRKKQIKWDPEHLKEVNNLPFLKRVWARTKHPETCSKCNGLDEYKREIDAKMVEKMRNITAIEEQLRHGKNHEKCHSRGNCDSHGDDTIEAAVVYEDVSSNEEKKREDEILKEKQRQEAIEKLNYHFYRRAIMESKLTGEAPDQIFKQYHRMNPQQLQQRFHAVYQKYLEMRKKMQEYYKNNQHREGEIHKEYIKVVNAVFRSLENKEGLEGHLDKYQKFLREVQERKRKEEEARKAYALKQMEAAKRAEMEHRRREQERKEQERHKAIYEKYLAEHRKAKEQKDKEDEYKKQELASLDKQLAEINILKENIKREIERTKKEGDEKDLASLEKLETELLQWEQKVKSDKEMKLSTLNVNILREKLMAELKADVVHGHHRNEESFENAKKRYLYVKENFNKQVNKVRDNLVRQKEAEEEYDSSVYKDEDEDDEEEEHEDYNTHERQLMEIDELKTHLTNELDKAKREGSHVRDIYQLEGARKQIEDWEDKVKNDNVHHYEKASLVNKKINEFKGFLNSYKVYRYSTTPKAEE
ncbi:hypothetical protein M8J75_000581 [Diaphorina citri]|nr:hypothetical protein M8J75_000581 [Diaphorina citri]